jgi:hypothetical protein
MKIVTNLQVLYLTVSERIILVQNLSVVSTPIAYPHLLYSESYLDVSSEGCTQIIWSSHVPSNASRSLIFSNEIQDVGESHLV